MAVDTLIFTIEELEELVYFILNSTDWAPELRGIIVNAYIERAHERYLESIQPQPEEDTNSLPNLQL